MYFIDACIAASLSVLMYVVIRYFITAYITKESFDVFTPTGLRLVAIFGLFIFCWNYYFVETPKEVEAKKQEEVILVSGKSFTAEKMSEIQKPLNTQISFDVSMINSAALARIVTPLAEYTFSSYGGCLQSVELLWQNGLKKVSMIQPDAPIGLVALDSNTPMQYDLVDQQYDAVLKIHTVIYQASLDGTVIRKTYTLYDASYQVDIKVVCQSIAGNQPEHFRLFIGSPTLSEELKAIVNKQGAKSFEISDISLSKDDVLQQLWFEPTLFGFNTKFLTTICFRANI